MQIEAFEDALDEHGSDLAGWPPELKLAAQRLLAESAEARDALAFAQQLEARLRGSTPDRAPAGLADRIVGEASADRQRQREKRRMTTPAGWRKRLPELSIAAVLAISFAGGVLASGALNRVGESDRSSYVSGLYADLAW